MITVELEPKNVMETGKRVRKQEFNLNVVRKFVERSECELV